MMKASLIQDRQRKAIFRWIALATLIFLAFLVNEVVGNTGYVARRKQSLKIQEMTQELNQLKQENQYLTERIQNLRSDPGAIEEMAREQLHLGRPGEIVVALPPRQLPQH